MIIADASGNKLPTGDADVRAIKTFPVLGGAGYKSYTVTSFVVGASPAIHDINANLGRNAYMGYIICDGAGEISMTINEGSGAGEAIIMKAGESFSFDEWYGGIDTITITHTGFDSSYRIFAK